MTSIQRLFPRTAEESTFPLCRKKREELLAADAGEEREGVGVGAVGLSSTCSWRDAGKFTKDTASLLNWNPGMDFRECTGLLGRYSHNQEGKACTQSRNYSL